MPLKIDVTGSSIRGGDKKLLDEIREIQRRFGSRALTTRAAKEAIDDYALLDVEPAVQRNLAGGILERRTGQLAARTRVTRPKVTARQVSFAIETNNIPYGLIHEVGGTIRPRQKKALTIPLPAALTPAGVVRKTAGELLDNPSPFESTFAAKGVIFGKRPNDSIEPLFALAQKVEIPARKWASSAIDDTISQLIRRLDEALTRQIQQSGR